MSCAHTYRTASRRLSAEFINAENTCVIEFPINHRAASMLITAWESTCRCLCELGNYFHQVQSHQRFGYHRYLILFRGGRGGCQAPDPRADLVMGQKSSFENLHSVSMA